MRAVVLRDFGPAAHLRVERVPDPVPGPGEVLVRILACGVCGHDLLARAGKLPRTVVPAILGHEPVGIVEAVGAGVEEFHPGDRVASTQRRTCRRCRFCRTGRETLCRSAQFYGEAIPGAYAELFVADAGSLTLVPAEVPDAAAAIAACAIGTCLHAIRRLRVGPGNRAMVTGAGGGLGVHALQLLQLAGAETVAATSSPRKAARLGELADHVVVAPDGRLARRLRQSGLRVDRVVDLTSSVTLGESLASVEPGGLVCVVGNVRTDPVEVIPGLLIVHELELIGSASATREDLEDALELLATARVEPVVSAVLSLEQAAEAHRLLEDREAIGRVVLAAG